MDMNSVFFGFLESLEEEQFVLLNSKKGLQNQARNYQYSFIEGLTINQNIISSNVIGLPSFGSYLISFKKLIIPSKKWIHNNSNFTSPGFLNFPIIKQINWFFFLVFYIRNLKYNKSKLITHFYSINPIWFLYSILLKFHGINNRVIIITDLPLFITEETKNKSLLHKVRFFFLKKSLKLFSHFVVVNENIARVLEIKKYTVIDGFVSEDLLNENINLRHTNIIQKDLDYVPTFLYAGNMEIEFGIIDLIQAVLKSNLNFKLLLFGSTTNQDIISLIKQTNKIEYFGYISNTKLKEYYKITDAFIIPRSQRLNLNKYSHPSKLYEYMSYLKPILMYKLDSISKLDRDMFLFFNEHSEEPIKEGIEFYLKSYNLKYNNYKIEMKKYLYLKSKSPNNQLTIHLNSVDMI